jgi:hypothetical protein
MMHPIQQYEIEYYDPDYNYEFLPTDPVNVNHVWYLSDPMMPNGYTCSAIAGIEGIQVMMQTIPLLDGTAIPNIYIPQTGTIGIAILVGRPDGGSTTDYLNLLDRVVRAFYNRRNGVPKPGTLFIKRPDGNKRQISVYTTSGLNTPEVGKNDYSIFSLSLSTPDPFWSDIVVSFYTFSLSLGVSAGILPLLPVSLDTIYTIGDTQPITINGDMPSYPTWIITGPGTPTMSNITTDRSWGLNTAIPAGQQVQVTTAPGKQGVLNLTTKVNWWGNLVFSGPHDLFPLVSGDNQVEVSIPDATPATSVQISYYNKWARA